MKYRVIHGNNIDILKTYPANHFDSIVTDPPYGIDFLGKAWDANTGALETYQECLRVLKPGGHILAFSAARTYHHLAYTLEVAGFEIRDQIMWIYSSGFPKAQKVDGFEGWRTALKPAHEPIVVARKPITQTVAANVLEYGTGAINIDDCRVEINQEVDDPRLGGKGTWKTENMAKNTYGNYEGKSVESSKLGRWPANVIHDGSDEVVSQFPVTKSGTLTPNMNIKESTGWSGGSKKDRVKSTFESNTGSAARFFYCAKASKSDRETNNNHPTVKPTDLMKYLCRLVTPKNGVVLDPFMGSGSTGKAAISEGFKFVGIEMSKEYFEIAEQRVKLNNIEHFMNEQQ